MAVLRLLRRDRAEREAGFTLIELLVYMFLGVVVLTIVGGILINSFRVEAQVRDASQSASTAQLVAESLGVGVRNASAIDVSQPDADSILVRTRSIDLSEEGEWYCGAWIVSNGELRWTRSATGISATPDASTIATWTLLADNVQEVDGNPIFAVGSNERSVSVRFTVGIGAGVPVLIDTVMVALQPIPATGKVTAPCF